MDLEDIAVLGGEDLIQHTGLKLAAKMDGKGSRMLVARAGLLCGGIVAVRADKFTATQQHSTSMVKGVGRVMGRAVDHPTNRLGATTTSRTVTTQTEAVSVKNSFDSWRSCQAKTEHESCWGTDKLWQ